MSDTPALDAFRDAMNATVDGLRSLAAEARLRRIYEIASAERPSPDDRLGDILMAAARAGSIDAAAAIAVLLDDGAPNLAPEVFRAIDAVVRRYPDLVEELPRAARSDEVSEYLEAEVAAGRLVAYVDRKTGETFYRRAG